MKRFAFLLLITLGFTANDVKDEIISLDWTLIDAGNPVFTEVGNNHREPDNTVIFDEDAGLPVFYKSYSLDDKAHDYEVVIENFTTEVWETGSKSIFVEVKNEFEIISTEIKAGDDSWLQVKIIPVMKTADNLIRLKSFTLKRIPLGLKSVVKTAQHTWQTESVLKNGQWLKISISEKGIYKIPYSKLTEWGFSNPQNVNVFGGGGKILSEDPGNIDYDDLPQVAVWHAENNNQDCLFFYAPGTTEWNPDSNGEIFIHKLNDYTTKGFFFLTEDVGNAKTINSASVPTGPATHQISTFDAYDLHEIEQYNILPEGSGKQWYGERFTNGTVRNIGFELSDSADDDVTFKIDAAGRSSASSALWMSSDEADLGRIEFQRVDTDGGAGVFADGNGTRVDATLDSDQLNIELTYVASNSSAEAWLDFIEVNYRKQLLLGSDVLFFRDIASAGDGNILEFSLESDAQEIRVFDVTDMFNVVEVPLQQSGNIFKGKNRADQLREYAAFPVDGDFPEPELAGEVENQNLHALSTPEFLIVTHPMFLETAEELADFHRNYDGMDVTVVEAPKIYNEFSSGAKSATGIRNFIKMFYDRDEQLKYVLLLGDGSYDNRNIHPESSNLIPTYQSVNSLSPTASFVTDDYFVILDDGESVYNGAVDLGIGRIPAATVFQAELVLNKIKNYYSSSALGTWRNVVSFIGDDEDGNLHMSQSDQLAEYITSNYKAFNTDKIYLDAFVQESSPAGERYPQVTDAINERVKNGVLILNYVGHANTRFLADEHVLDVSNINSWSNVNSLPIFVTATCEFSRFDADDQSAGEYILFNPNGGGIALFSTTRLVYSHSNFKLSRAFYQHVFERDENGDYYRMGDIMRLAKINTRDIGINKRNFSLLADPALRLSYPRHNVLTTEINQQGTPGGVEGDTIGALQKITVSGIIADQFGNRLDDFSGELTPTVYGKRSMMETMANDGGQPMSFMVRENIIYKGLASVTNGEFSFSFVIPKDISYSIGQGKIHYYAENDETDAHGAYEDFYIGGDNDSEISDNQGPQIELYMDSPDFVSGNQVGKNPVLFANLYDENGINTVGTGIGHDITAVLDNDYSNVFVMNNYYQTNVDDYTGGTIRFPFQNLAPGEHTLTLKAWDVANNSSEVEIKFVVNGSFEISSIMVYPNPVGDYTFFVFEHNQSDETLETIFEIFDQAGRRIDYFTTQVGSNGTSSNPVRWDLNELNGRLKNGIYLYRVIARNNEGVIAAKSGKMVVVH